MTNAPEHDVRALDGARLRDALQVAEHWLERNREAINAINVYPVPDGDTGTNMLLTLRAALAPATELASVGELTASMAEAALLGARGNSGVILSQMLRGFADALTGCSVLGAEELAAALADASRTAYEAVPEPVEGTMLTVLREASEAVGDGSGRDLESVLSGAVEAAEASVERTPALLPRLREAGVVDAGGQGVAVLLAGLRYGVRGEPLPEAPATPEGAIDLAAVEHEGHGYCVEFVVQGEALDRSAIASALDGARGDSILVVGDHSALHVHVHMVDPGPALSAGAAHGALQAVKVDNMQAQHERWAAGHEAAGAAAPEPPAIGLVAVVQGAGLQALFRELGATAIVDGGATNNPSAGDLLEAARRAGRERVFVLPNDPNVIMAAEQAARQAPELVSVVPTRSVAAGLAAAISFVPGQPPEEIAERLQAGARAVRCLEVTRAVRETSVDGLRVASGDAIALLDGRLVARAADLNEALLAGLAEAIDETVELVSVYLGAEAPADAEERLAGLLESAHPGIAVEVVPGGQPHYPYIVGLE